VFGDYSDNTRNTFNKRYASSINIQSRQASLTGYIELLKDNPLTVRKLCNSYFEQFGPSGSREDYIFLLDANSWQDIVDYINLKALGLNVLPLPLQVCMTSEAKSLAEDFIQTHYRKYNQNNVYYTTTLLKSRTCTEQQQKDFADTLNIQQAQGE